jgi:hypothetical protein
MRVHVDSFVEQTSNKKGKSMNIFGAVLAVSALVSVAEAQFGNCTEIPNVCSDEANACAKDVPATDLVATCKCRAEFSACLVGKCNPFVPGGPVGAECEEKCPGAAFC